MNALKRIISEIDLRTRRGQIKMLLLVVVFTMTIVAVPLATYGAWKQTTSSETCSTCHAMKPEYFTLQASAHVSLTCLDCHKPDPGISNYTKYIAKGGKEIFYTLTDSYPTPIKMLDPISDAVCERCHNMDNRKVTAGDLIVPHDVHKKARVKCYECHKNIAHGGIANRKVTYRSDYYQWDGTLGKSLMSDPKYRSVDMDVCMRCHQLRKGPLNCDACHTTGMVPPTHSQDGFKEGSHGKISAQELIYCDSCHSYMSREKIEKLEEPNQYEAFLGKDKPKVNITVADYAKSNTFCRDCHSTRPPSHQTGNFAETHGQKIAENCRTCHADNPGAGISKIPACGTCHPSPHIDLKIDQYHPVEIPQSSPKVNDTCYQCHLQNTCQKCHRSGTKEQF